MPDAVARGGSASGWIVEADVPDGVVAVTAAELAGQLTGLRDSVADAGIGYLGVIAAERADRTTVIVLAIAVVAMEFPAGTDPAALVAAMLRREYPRAAVEVFGTASGTAVGMQRRESRNGRDGGVSQALVPFGDAGLVGAVTGFCLDAADLEMAMVFTATIAHRMRAVPG